MTDDVQIFKGSHIVTQSGGKFWLREVKKVYWDGLTAKAELHSGEVVTLGEYESNDEKAHVAQTCRGNLNFLARYRFPEYGYYKKWYADED